MVPGGARDGGVEPGVRGAGGGVEHGAGFSGPLHAALAAAAGGIGAGWELEFRMRGVVGGVEEKRLCGLGGAVFYDPFFSAGGEETGGVAEVETGGDLAGVFPDLALVLLRVVKIAVPVADVAVVKIETAPGGVGGPGGGVAAGRLGFAFGGGGVAGGFQDGGEGVVGGESLVNWLSRTSVWSCVWPRRSEAREGAQTGAARAF